MYKLKPGTETCVKCITYALREVRRPQVIRHQEFAEDEFF